MAFKEAAVKNKFQYTPSRRFNGFNRMPGIAGTFDLNIQEDQPLVPGKCRVQTRIFMNHLNLLVT
jgi:hypothetical protein